MAVVNESAVGRASESGAIRQAMQVSKAQDIIKDTQSEINALGKENNKLKQDSLRLEAEIFNQIKAGADLTTTDKDKTKKEKKEKLTTLQAMEKAFNVAAKEAQVYGNYQETLADKAKILQTAIGSLLEEGLNPQSRKIKELTQQWQALGAAAEMPKLDTVQSEVQFQPIQPNTDWAKGYFEVYSKLVEANRMAAQSNVAFADTFNLIGAKMGNVQAAITGLLEKGFSVMSPQVQALMEQLKLLKIELDWNNVISNLETSLEQLIEGTFVGFGEALGSIFSGAMSGVDALEQFGRSVISSMGDLLSSFGQQLIALGVGKMALDSMFAFPGGGALAIAAGTALVAAGSAISKSMQKKAGSLSPSGGGGGVSAPKMNAPRQRGPQEVVFKLQGRELVGLMESEQYRQGRIYGRPL